MASNYNECLSAIINLDAIETQYSACIEDDYLSDFVSSMSEMMSKIFRNEEKEFSDIMNGILINLVIKWINNPYMLFRHYSIYYFIKEFEKYE